MDCETLKSSITTLPTGYNTGEPLTYDELRDMFLTQSYGTEDNYQRSYGGEVEDSGSKVSSRGILTITFNRDIVFPRELLAEYEP